MSNLNFYKDLPYVESFEEVTNPKLFREVPQDWYVLIADVQNSTIEIEEGRYKEVNFVGACAITSVLNIDKRIDLPFVFGGDGASILVPPNIIEKAEDALRDTKRFAMKYLNLNIRIAKIPVIELQRNRYLIKIVKVKVAENYYQSVFAGGGVDFAETLAKREKKYTISDIPPKHRANFKGLECVWQDIPGRKEEVLNLLIKATSDSVDHTVIYNEVFKEVQEIYGPKDSRFPIDSDSIKIRFSLKKVRLESMLYSYQYHKSFKSVFYKALFSNFIDSIFRFFRTSISKLLIRAYENAVVHSVDSEKFDDMLRMVIAGTKEQRHRLIGFLEELYNRKMLAYGVHVTHSVYMTCLIFERQGKQVHFIDGSNGGYTYAAKELKNKVKWQRMYL